METVANLEALQQVRENVAEILRRTAAYWRLDDEDRRALADNIVKAGAFISGAATGVVPEQAEIGGRRVLLHGRADAAGDDLTVSAARQDPQPSTDMIQRVDFPQFVAGLIDGVFSAIVTFSIQQTEAYAELLQSVAKSVDEYTKDNVTENQARDYLVEQCPDDLELDTSGEQPQLAPKQGAKGQSLPDFIKALGLAQPIDSLDDQTSEQVLMAARKKIAMDRQQLLATMILMGINRLIVTDGQINATVLF